MHLRSRIGFVLACIWSMAGLLVEAQPAEFRLDGVADVVTNLDRPRIAVAPDGSSAVAFEALVQGQFIEEWKVAVQRFSPAGAPVGPTHFFEPESGCGTFDSWSSDAQHHAELAFRSDGVLIVVMQHSGWFSISADDIRSSEVTIGAIGPDGRVVDLKPQLSNCEQYKLIFVGGGRQDRPRVALTPTDEMLITADGFFQGSDLRNVAVRVLDAQLNELVEGAIPHDDPGSQQAFHMQPDVATNGAVVLSTWQECPIVDRQGNANECDIRAQFATVAQNGLQAMGGNRPVNAGDPVGTINILPAAAMNAAGNSVIVWADTRTGPQGDVFGQRFDAQGQPVGQNFRVSQGQGALYYRPEVAMLDDGAFMVVWTDSTAGGFRARARQYDAAGNPLGGPVALTQDGTMQTGQPDVASNGRALVAIWGGSRGGSLAIYSSNLGTIVANEAAPGREAFGLEAYPSPFTEAATLRYTLGQAGHVVLAVYDLLGREVARLVDGSQGEGVHTASLGGADLPAGTYFVRLRQGGRQQVRMLVRTE